MRRSRTQVSRQTTSSWLIHEVWTCQQWPSNNCESARFKTPIVLLRECPVSHIVRLACTALLWSLKLNRYTVRVERLAASAVYKRRGASSIQSSAMSVGAGSAEKTTDQFKMSALRMITKMSAVRTIGQMSALRINYSDDMIVSAYCQF